MNKWINARKEMPKDGDYILVNTFCKYNVGWFCDYKNGIDYEEYLMNFVPEDENDKPVCKEDYEADRWFFGPEFSNNGRNKINWTDVYCWMSIPEVPNFD